jgi:hypothetical protein
MQTKEHKTQRRTASNKPHVDWAWKKQGTQYIVYSNDRKDIVGVGYSLRDAKAVFVDRFNEHLRSIGSDYRLRLR